MSAVNAGHITGVLPNSKSVGGFNGIIIISLVSAVQLSLKTHYPIES